MIWIKYKFWFNGSSYLPIDHLSMFKNGNYIPNDCDSQVHHDIFAEIHEHVLLYPVLMGQTFSTALVKL